MRGGGEEVFPKNQPINQHFILGDKARLYNPITMLNLKYSYNCIIRFEFYQHANYMIIFQFLARVEVSKYNTLSNSNSVV